MRKRDNFERFLAIEDKNYRREMKRKAMEQVKRDSLNIHFL